MERHGNGSANHKKENVYQKGNGKAVIGATFYLENEIALERIVPLRRRCYNLKN